MSATSPPPRRLRVALVRHHDLCLNTRQIASVQRRSGTAPHLGMGYVATALRKDGFRVLQVDSPALRLDGAGLRRVLRDFSPDLVGVTTTTPALPGAVEACRAARSVGARVVLGGSHTEVYGVENLVHECIDYVAVGEGTTIMVEVARRLEAGQDPDGVVGLVTRQTDGGSAPAVNLQDVGWPTREGLPMARFSSIMAPQPLATMISSRGCPFTCSFCFKQAVDSRCLFREATDVVDEMHHLVDRWGVREIMFYDDVFTLRRARVREIVRDIRARGLRVRWDAPTRVDLVEPELLSRMAAAGCVRLRFGIEHGDPQILEQMNKDSDLDKIERAVRATAAAGIQPFGYFIVGWLGETREQFERTMELACRLPFGYASFYTATPLPGTRLHSEAVTAGAVPSDFWDCFVAGDFERRIDFLVPEALSRVQEAYRRFFLRRSMTIPLTRHMAVTGQWRATASALMAVARTGRNRG